MEEMWDGVRTSDIFGSGWHQAALRLVTRQDHLCSPAPLRLDPLRLPGRLLHPASLAREGQKVIEVPGASTAGIAITDFSHTAWLMAESRATSRAFIRQYRLGVGTK